MLLHLCVCLSSKFCKDVEFETLYCYMNMSILSGSAVETAYCYFYMSKTCF